MEPEAKRGKSTVEISLSGFGVVLRVTTDEFPFFFSSRSTTSCSKEFQELHEGHFPIHWVDWVPQTLQ